MFFVFLYCVKIVNKTSVFVQNEMFDVYGCTHMNMCLIFMVISHKGLGNSSCTSFNS